MTHHVAMMVVTVVNATVNNHMLDLSNGPLGKNDWARIDWETEEIFYDESGGRIPFSTKEVVFTHGKYVGYKLSEVSDSWYLKFIRDKNADDGLIQLAFNKRLGELAI